MYKQKSSYDNLIFGMRPVIEALQSGKQIENLFMQEGLTGPLAAELKTELKNRGIFYKSVPVEKLNRLTNKNHQGVACFISPIPFESIEDIVPMTYENGENPFVVVLDRITDVRNFGAIARSAECAGVHALVVPQQNTAQINGDTIKTSAGALHKIPVCKERNLKHSLDFLQDSGTKIVAVSEKAEKAYYEVDLSGPITLILGSEEDGISPEYLRKADHLVKIPMVGTIESLNVSVAAGILFFEILKQRTKAN